MLETNKTHQKPEKIGLIWMASFIKYLIFPFSIYVHAARLLSGFKRAGETPLELEVIHAPSSGLLLCFRPPIVIQSNPLSHARFFFLHFSPFARSPILACLPASPPARLSYPFPPSLCGPSGVSNEQSPLCSSPSFIRLLAFFFQSPIGGRPSGGGLSLTTHSIRAGQVPPALVGVRQAVANE